MNTNYTDCIQAGQEEDPCEEANERVHGVEPDRASQDHRGDPRDAQRGDLQVSRQEVEDPLPGDTSQMDGTRG